MRPRGTKDLHHAGQQPVRAGAHVDRLDGKPGRVDPDHRNISRRQVAQSPARHAGQRMTIVVGPRVRSMRISGGADAAGVVGICTATKPGWPLATRGPTREASTTQRLGMLTFRPLASATAAIDKPGCWQARMTRALNSERGACVFAAVPATRQQPKSPCVHDEVTWTRASCAGHSDSRCGG